MSSELYRRRSVIESDKKKLELYNEFYRLLGKADLLRRDPIEYWREARRYLEPRLREFT